MSQISEKLEAIVESINTLETKSDFSQAMFSIANLFHGAKKEDVDNILSKNSHFNPLYYVFANKHFNKAALGLLKRDGRELEEEKKIVNSGLRLSTFVLAYVFPHISVNSIIYLRDELNKHIGRVKYIQGTNGLTCTGNDVCSVFLETIFNFDNEHQEKYSGYISFDVYREKFTTSRALIAAMLFMLHQEAALGKAFKEFTYQQKSLGAKFHLPVGLNSLNTQCGMLESLAGNVPINSTDDFNRFVDAFNISRNIKIASHIIKMATDGFERQESPQGIDSIKQKISNAQNVKKDLDIFARKNFRAYSGNLSGRETEWSNKIYLITRKTLSSLEALDGARDSRWLVDVFYHEYYQWAHEIHKVVNKHDIEDDWEKIKDLTSQEDSRVEWKSTFYTPTEQLFFNEVIEKEKGKEILRKVVEAMLGMMNSEGGTVLVGLVENPQAIVREDIKKNTVSKGGLTFFDVRYELDKRNKSVDDVKREIQDILYSKTLYTAEKFNNIWNIEQVEIKSEGSSAMVYKISVAKSEKFVYDVKKENDSLWIGLTKRADGRTIFVDPRDSLA